METIADGSVVSAHTFEEILARDGILVYKTVGISMLPMLRQRRDLVVVAAKADRLKKYDVALYRRGELYILHRVVGVRPDGYRIRGDATYALETVPEEDVLGVLTGFVRDGKQYSVTDRGYQAYSRVWTAIYPLRWTFHTVKIFIKRVARKLGLLPYLRALRRRLRGKRRI